MITYSGKSVFDGIAIGKIRVCKKKGRQIERVTIDNLDIEMERFERAKAEASAQLKSLYDKALGEVGETGAAIFEIHRMLLDDGDYNQSVEDMVRTQGVNAEYAVASAGDQFFRKFAEMSDDYMKERAEDVKDISERLLEILSGSSSATVGLDGADMSEKTDMSEEPIILVAEDLVPSETVQLDKDKVLAFVTVHGSTNSHTAILARTMGIPALVGCDIPLDESVDGRLAIVDGRKGCVYVDPGEELLEKMQACQQEEQSNREMLRTLKGKESVTLDGRKVALYANIGNLKDLESALENDAEGVGLFRSEFLYLESNHLPTEEEQFRVYKTVAEAMAGKRVIIRTLDIGADKKCDYLGLEAEENPALGYLGIRICLTRTDIFKTQFRALFRAGAFGNIAVMYPMIISLDEVREIQKIVEEVRAELTAEGTPFGELEQGLMIETPAAVMMSRELAREVDFFSIGTNDLTQYTLAIDRQNPKLDAFYDAHHPAVLRMIAMVAENAHKENIPVGICGELGADPELTEEFLKMGIDELSVSPNRILPLRKRIREMNLEI